MQNSNIKSGQNQNNQNLAEAKPKITNTTLALNQNMHLLDIVAPQEIEEDFDYIKINDVYFRTLFIGGYPRFVAPGWLEPVVNFDSSLDISFYVYPVDGKSVLDDLRRKIAEMEAEIATDIERGRIVDPSTQAKLEDARALQEQLVKGIERFYEFSFYITIPASSVEELNHVTKQIESQLGSLLIVSKHALLDMEQGFLSTAPFGMDRLNITRNMDTTSVATTFPLTSTELSSDRGVLYGINSQNESFIIFDRFSLQNSNMVIFATSGAGKSVAYDVEVLYKDKGGLIKKEKIGKLIDNVFKKQKSIKLEKDIEGVITPGINIFSFNKNLKKQWSSVEIAARKISPKNLYQIETASGRKIKITKDHCLVILKDGKIVTAKGNEIKNGDYIPVPREILKNQDSVEKYRGQNINDEILTLLGLTTSEGHVENDFVTISNTNPEILELIKACSKKLNYKISPSYNYPGHKKINGYHLRGNQFSVFVNNIGSGGDSSNKRVPDLIFNLSDKQISTYLKAYFEGDGGVEPHGISATTKSKMLASDLTYLLLGFGIIARIREKSKAAVNTVEKKKRKYYTVSISGQENVNRFINKIGFITKEKNNKAKLLIKKSNTNVDVIPELKTILKEIYHELYNSEVPAPKYFSEIKLGVFRPSRKELSKIISQIKNRIYEIESLEKDGISKLQSLPTVRQIIQRGKNRKINAVLWRALGASWQTMRSGTVPFTHHALEAAKITYGYDIEIDEIGRSLYRSFKFTGQSLQKFDSSLWSTILYKHANARYEKIIKARDFITDIFDRKVKNLQKIKEKVGWLEKLAKSDLFWDPVVKISEVKYGRPYVYDLQVKDAVFMAGYGGLFVHNSYFVKLEALRSLMTGTEAIIIDPEAEYKPLAQAVGGEYISFSFNSPAKINPFDLSQIREEGENQLGLKILSLHSLMKVIMGAITPTQEAMLDRALVMTYRNKGITMDPDTQGKEPPLMEDLYKTLIGMEVPEALDLAARIEKFVRGSFVGIFDKQTNINITNPFTVFSVKDLQDALRPIAMFIILDFIWTRVKKDLKRRILIVDEAWHMMRYPDTAQFLWSVVKRARKYYLGLTTITQDVEDFLGQDIGKAIVTNSALEVLLKQSPAAIDKIGEVFYLSQGEKQLLLAANVGEGIFFAGPHHAPIRVVASEAENRLITTKPEEMAKINPNAYEAK